MERGPGWLDYEMVLRLFGWAALAGAVIIVVSQGQALTSYEDGQIFGRAAAYVVFPLIVAAVGHFLIRRHYEGDGGRWSTLTPEALAAAGLISITLASVFGPPETDTQRLLDESAACSDSQQSPIAALPAGDVRELNEDEISQMPGGAQMLESLPGVAKAYEASDGASILVIAIGDDPDDHAEAERGFVDGVNAQGIEAKRIALAGGTATGLSPAGAEPAAFFAHSGCYAFFVGPGGSTPAAERTELMLAGGSAPHLSSP